MLLATQAARQFNVTAGSCAPPQASGQCRVPLRRGFNRPADARVFQLLRPLGLLIGHRAAGLRSGGEFGVGEINGGHEQYAGARRNRPSGQLRPLLITVWSGRRISSG